MNSLTINTSKKEVNKKDLIIDLYNQGKTTKEICIELKANSTYVYNVIKKYKETNVTNVTNESNVVNE
ncbi:hypothetical protein D3C78_1848660 [compost metagenome]